MLIKRIRAALTLILAFATLGVFGPPSASLFALVRKYWRIPSTGHATSTHTSSRKPLSPAHEDGFPSEGTFPRTVQAMTPPPDAVASSSTA